MLLVRDASGSLEEQNGSKNKTTWLTQTALNKSFSLFYITCIEDIKGFFNGLFFSSKLVLYQKIYPDCVFGFLLLMIWRALIH